MLYCFRKFIRRILSAENIISLNQENAIVHKIVFSDIRSDDVDPAVVKNTVCSIPLDAFRHKKSLIRSERNLRFSSK